MANTAPLDLAAIAGEVQDAQDRALSIAPFSTRLAGFDLAAAYAAAARLRDARRQQGDVPVGRKIGFTNASLWDVYDVHAPIWGHMYRRTVLPCDAGDVHCSLRGLCEPKIEPEIVFGLRAAPSSTELPALLACIDWVAHGFEIVQSHYPGWKFKAPDTVADGGLHGRLLLGPRQPINQLGPALLDQLSSFSLTLSRDGVALETGHGRNVLGSPLAALGHLVAVLADQPVAEHLRAGEIVTTGTVTGAYSVHAGEVWTTRLDGIALPGLTARFTA